MKLNRVMIAAMKSGSGKTSVTCALLRALKGIGENVVSYKCGPDYIDPMFHKNVIGVPSKNLDTFFTDDEKTLELFIDGRAEGDFAVLEGVMGLYDGLGGIMEEGSSYHLARVTKTPIILVVDAKGAGRSLLPMLSGFLDYDKERLIRGVILNRISISFYEIIRPLLENELHIPVLGFLSENREFSIGSRHLGLMLPEEMKDLREKLHKISEEFKKNVPVNKIIEIAGQADELECRGEKTSDFSDNSTNALPKETADIRTSKRPIIAVAYDKAFCFYYEDNLRLLEEYGADLEYFSPLSDRALPKGCCGLLLGGGYPELYAAELAGNSDMLSAIRRAWKDRLPIVAECGGFMYLHSVITDREGKEHKMADVLPEKCYYTERLVRFGYVEITENSPCFLPKGGRIRGHEFHYYDSGDSGSGCTALKPLTGKTYPCVHTGENYWVGFPHLYYPSNPEFAENFVRKAGKYKNRGERTGYKYEWTGKEV